MNNKEAKKYLPFITALANDTPIQCWNGSEWRDVSEASFLPGYEYRIKPMRKLRVWKADEVPVDALFRGANKIACRICYADLQNSSRATVAFANVTHMGLDELCEDREYSTNGGKTWLPCGVTE